MINKNNYKNNSKTLIPVNEGLFGFGSAAKPSMQLTADYIRGASNEDIANILVEYANYFMDKTNSDANKAVDAFVSNIAELLKAVKEDVKTGFNFFNSFGLAIKNSIMGKYKSIKGNTKNLGNLLIFSVAALVKCGVSGYDTAIRALSNVYNIINTFLSEAWTAFIEKFDAAKDNIVNFIQKANDNIKLFLAVAGAVFYLISMKVTGAAQAFQGFINKILTSVKNNSLFAVFIVRTWFGTKSQELLNFVSTTFNDVKQTCVNVWNKLEKPVLQAWKKTTESLLNWMSNIKLGMDLLNQKIKDITTNVKNSAIGAKDNMASAVIKKAVRSLNKQNYPLDKVMDMVKAAYNESVTINNGKHSLNESLFMHALKRQVKRYNRLNS